MPPLKPITPYYTRVTRVYVESDEREQNIGPNNPAKYRFKLNKAIRDVFAMEIVGWQFPDDITPSFLPNPLNTNVDGDDKVDFSLFNVGLGVEAIFSITLPPFSFFYQSATNPNRSFVDKLVQLMNDAIFTDPNYGAGSVKFFAKSDSFERTFIEIRSNAPFATTDEVTLTFLFGTGPNAQNSAAIQMGFLANTDSNPSASQGILVPLQVLESPFNSDLIPRPYVDVYIAQQADAGLSTSTVTENFVRRIYTSSTPFQESFSTEVGIGPDKLTRMMPNDTRRIEHLDISLLMSDGTPPITTKEHSFIVKLYSLARVIDNPSAVMQQQLLI